MVYRVSAGSCPRCGTRLAAERSGPHRFSRCRGCRGVWIEESVIASMLAEMGAAPPALTIGRAEQALSCGFCGQRMDKGELHGILVDRCQRHGWWFDGSELQKTLASAAGLEVESPDRERPEVSLLSKLFSSRD